LKFDARRHGPQAEAVRDVSSAFLPKPYKVDAQKTALADQCDTS
jgi:hypothetical protein